LAGDTAKQKAFRPFNASLIIGAIAIKRLRSSSRRPACPAAGMKFLIQSLSAFAGLDHKTPLSDLCGSAVNLILKDAHAIKKPNEST